LSDIYIYPLYTECVASRLYEPISQLVANKAKFKATIIIDLGVSERD